MSIGKGRKGPSAKIFLTMRLASLLFGLFVVGLAAFVCVSPAQPQTQELFDWRSFSAQQETLVHRADGLTEQLGGSAAVAEKGAAIKQVLSNLMRGLRRRASSPPRKRYIPMDQELAILKVQKQMRTEQKFGTDRIDSGGDVAAVVNEQEQADERSALMEDPDMGPDTKTNNLFENCEDGSLTAEDAELCGRRASAIKMITRAAVKQQLEKEPPVSPGEVQGMRDALNENKARKELVSYALIGKQYVALMDEEKKADTETKSQRNALLAEGRHTRSTHQALAASHQGLSAPPVRHGATTRLEHGKQIRSQAKATAQPAPAVHKAAAAQPPSRSAGDEEHGSRVAFGGGSRGNGAKKKVLSLGDLGPLQDIADAMPTHLSTPKTDSNKRLTDLEGAISDTQARLAKEKMRFTKEMLKRQKQLQAEFLDSMDQIHAGLSVVDDVAVPGSHPDNLPSGQSVLAAEQAAFMQRQRDGVIAAAASAAGPTPSVLQRMNPVVAEVQREISASHLFRHPPKPELASKHKSAEDVEKETVQAALDAQFDQVASDGSVTRKVRHDKWSDLMSQMSQNLAMQTPTADLPDDSSASSQEVKGSAVGGAAMAGTKVGGRNMKHTGVEKGMRLLSSYGFKQGLHRGHVGPASYDALAAAAKSDLTAAMRTGAPTLEVATKDALEADEVIHNPQVGFSPKLLPVRMLRVGVLRRAACVLWCCSRLAVSRWQVRASNRCNS